MNADRSAHRQPRGACRPWIDAAAIFALCALVLVLYRQIALTNLILPGADAITYFYPYRAYAADAIRSGRVPLWNPFLFLGVPFVANPQAGVFYPPNLLLAWLLHPAPPGAGPASPGAGDAPRLVAWSLVLHAALAACGTYLYGRCVLRLSPLPALLGASAFALGGFLSGQAEHVNQLNVSAWLPILLLLWEARHRARWPALLSLGLVIGVALLAGHTQSSYITLAGLGVYALLEAVLSRPTTDALRQGGKRGSGNPLRALARTAGPRACYAVSLFSSLWQLGFALMTGLALAAVQLLPTIELSRLSIRSGGLTFREAVAFSLRPLPRLLRYTFLPPWGRNLSDVFGGDFYTEYVAYIGLLPLLLATLASMAWVWRVARGDKNLLYETKGRAELALIVLATLGIVLALGLYNPLYWVLFKVVPGFGLFRVPARWLLLYAFGVAVLAGVGLQHISDRLEEFTRSQLHYVRPLEQTLIALLLAAAVGELLAAARTLPITHPTAPGAFSSLRTAPAHILAAQRQQAAPGRFLSLSHTLFDPGDLAEIQQIYQDQIPPQAIYDYVVNVKRQEILAPNLPLAWHIYAVDGYDGGVLPLAHYIRLQGLLLDEEDILDDGRLREGLERIPSSRLLSILGARYVITDKVHDVWIDDVFYDLAFDTPLSAAETPSVTSVDLPDFVANGLGIVTYLAGAQNVTDGTRIARIHVTTVDGETLTHYLHAGLETSEGLYDGRVRHRQAQVGHRWQRTEGESVLEGNDYVARYRWAEPCHVAQIEVEALPFGPSGTGRLHVRGVSLIDERDGSNVPLILSNRGLFRRVHSGDVKVYEALDVLPRAYTVHHTRLVQDDEAALAAMADPTFDPARTAILAAGYEIDERPSGDTASSVTVLSYAAEEIVLQASLPAPGYVVMTDSWYPGWSATVDGKPVTIERANLAFRAVHVPQGMHVVRWTYRPRSYLTGLWISVAALLSVAATLLALYIRRRHHAPGSQRKS
jgi:hypothetical protein